MTIPDKTNRLQWIYSARDKRDIAERYDAWAEDYDGDIQSYGYRIIPALVAGFVVRYTAPDDGAVLDAGAGTGIIGEILAALNYRDLVAIDLSQGMLEVARRKNVYRDLQQMELGKPLGFPDDAFAVTVAAGVLTLGHAPPESLDELVRITRPGGHIIFTMREDTYVQQGFKGKQDLLEQQQRWRLIETTEPVQSLPLADPGLKHRVLVYQVS